MPPASEHRSIGATPRDGPRRANRIRANRIFGHTLSPRQALLPRHLRTIIPLAYLGLNGKDIPCVTTFTRYVSLITQDNTKLRNIRAFRAVSQPALRLLCKTSCAYPSFLDALKHSIWLSAPPSDPVPLRHTLCTHGNDHPFVTFDLGRHCISNSRVA